MSKLTIFSCLTALGITLAINIQPAEAQNISTNKKVKTAVSETSFRNIARGMPETWYKTREARTVADSVLAYQFPGGGWAKNQNWHQKPDAKKWAERANIRKLIASKEGIGSTIDNMSTTIELLFLAKMYKATGKKLYRDAFMRGFEYLLEAQYDNGGWPQYYPLKKPRKNGPDYSVHITYNDDAMSNVIKLMRDLAEGDKAPYDALKLSETDIQRAKASYDKAIQCIVNSQIRKNGKLTVWCQQHHYETLLPVQARAYEFPSFTGCGETADLVELLMGVKNPSPEVKNAVICAIEWLRNHAIKGYRHETFKNAEGKKDRRLVPDANAPLLWARNYDLETEKPYYGDRDGKKHDNYADISYDRRNGYTWLNTDVQGVLDKYPKWYTKHHPGNYQTGDYGYLYCHMSDRGEWTAYALSRDGLHFHDLINGDPIMDRKQHARIEGGQRDAFICRQHDGKGYLMVTTDMRVSSRRELGKVADWDNFGIDLLTSKDLIQWESVTFDYRKGDSIFCDPESPGVYKDWSTINRVWAPQIFWDRNYQWPDGKKGGYFIYYSMWNRAEEKYDRMYYSYADETFTKLTKPQLLFDWGYATIDADINYIPADGLYHMMIKKEGGTPGIFTATSKKLTGPWADPVADDYVNFEGNKKCEGASAFQLVGDSTWRVAYIEYSSRPKNYRICKADKYLRNFTNPQNIEGVNGPQHGSFMRLTKEEYERLQAWSDSLEAKHIAPNEKNPVFPGLHADPEILYSQQTGKYYIYPTTDGAEEWKSHEFKVFSSTDLQTWTDEGVMFDLQKDCNWTDWYAWAPCIIECKYIKGKLARTPKEMRKNGKKVSYKYFYYFTAGKNIGVAVADKPEGPFKDALGKPLLNQPPAGIKAQVIDPDVFMDPQTGKYYLYWGNSFLACSELNEDMISIKEGSTKVLINRPDKKNYGYNEGTYVFYRNGKYYFMWSENDTRSANYRVRYLISDSPTEFVCNGKPAQVERTIVLHQDPSKQIYGTGHHSILQKPGTDEWYIVYHRFARPESIKLGWSAGYNREICIDRLEFNEDGTIKPVKTTL
ncbi:MAG: pectate lyase [Bacteroidaceae bacterium]|nr:pectate lyase [Bacteroidaceae bacterium]